MSDRFGPFLMKLASLAAVVAWACGGCADWTQNEPTSHNIAGCAEAVQHLHECCPAYSSYISCSVLESAANSNAFPDLTERQSRCLRGKSCDEIAAAVGKNDGSLCGYSLASRNCH
jgi:hypothetical protein